jgi:hypothetical protein
VALLRGSASQTAPSSYTLCFIVGCGGGGGGGGCVRCSWCASRRKEAAIQRCQSHHVLAHHILDVLYIGLERHVAWERAKRCARSTFVFGCEFRSAWWEVAYERPDLHQHLDHIGRADFTQQFMAAIQRVWQPLSLRSTHIELVSCNS